MSECCDNTLNPPVPPRTAVCPVDGKRYKGVQRRTILHQLAKPWMHALPDQGYYFCSNPSCDAVYFGQDDQVIDRGQLRQIVGQKSSFSGRPVCYCFDICYQDLTTARHGSVHQLRNFVIRQVQQGNCQCDVRNPAGRCCLADFPEHADP